MVRFTHLLRLSGIKIGSGEVIDALNTLQEIDISHRETVKTALRAVLIKRKGEREVFDRTFDLFFSPMEEKERQQMEHQKREEQKQEQMEQAEEDLTFDQQEMDLSEEEKLTYGQMPEEEKEKIKNYLDNAEQGMTREWEKSVKPMLEVVVKGALRRWMNQHKDEVDLQNFQHTGDDELDSILEDLGQNAPSREDQLMYEDMQNIDNKDIPKANQLIRKLARHLVTRITRRYKRSKKHQMLDLRRTIRENIRFGGTMFKLKYRSKKIQKPKLVLICDVSGSMSSYASFVLQFIYGIHSVLGQIETFIFSDNLERITPYFQPGSDFNQLMVDIMNKSKVWGGGTRLNKTLQTLQKEYSEVITGDAYIIILSDTKTEATSEALEELLKIKKQAKDILWLNTLPEEEWANSKTTRIFQKHVKMYPSNTLSDVEKITRSKIFQ